MAEMNAILSFKPSLRRSYFFALIYACLVLYGRYATNLDRSFNQIWLIMLGVLIVLMALVFLRRATTDYIVNDTGVVSSWGIIARNTSAVAYDRITNAAARQTILDRILGISSVFFDTAGGPAPEVVFKRINSSDASQLISYLREYAQKHKTVQSAVAGTV